jgi:N-acyl-D-aspartate/D-glutamate deacylase
MCEAETDFECRDCGKPVCEDCCVVPTYMNQIDYAKCKDCELHDEVVRIKNDELRWKAEEEKKAKKDKAKKKRFDNYCKPENIEKRRLAKIERKKLKAEQNKKMFEEIAKIVGDIFRGL